jgi:hypothetical protein
MKRPKTLLWLRPLAAVMRLPGDRRSAEGLLWPRPLAAVKQP